MMDLDGVRSGTRLERIGHREFHGKGVTHLLPLYCEVMEYDVAFARYLVRWIDSPTTTAKGGRLQWLSEEACAEAYKMVPK